MVDLSWRNYVPRGAVLAEASEIDEVGALMEVFLCLGGGLLK